MHLAPVLGGKSDVYAIQGGRLLRFGTDNRRLVWNRAGGYVGQPALAAERIYAYSDAGTRLKVLDETSGQKLWLWQAPQGETLQSNIVLTDTHAFVGTQSATYCIDLAQHAMVWSTPVAGSLALDAGHLFIAGQDGRLTAIALGSGA